MTHKALVKGSSAGYFSVLWIDLHTQSKRLRNRKVYFKPSIYLLVYKPTKENYLRNVTLSLTSLQLYKSIIDKDILLW